MEQGEGRLSPIGVNMAKRARGARISRQHRDLYFGRLLAQQLQKTEQNGVVSKISAAKIAADEQVGAFVLLFWENGLRVGIFRLLFGKNRR